MTFPIPVYIVGEMLYQSPLAAIDRLQTGPRLLLAGVVILKSTPKNMDKRGSLPAEGYRYLDGDVNELWD